MTDTACSPIATLRPGGGWGSCFAMTFMHFRVRAVLTMPFGPPSFIKPPDAKFRSEAAIWTVERLSTNLSSKPKKSSSIDLPILGLRSSHDFNVHFGWCPDDCSVAVPAGRGSKLQASQDQAMTRGLRLMRQINHDKPSFISRKDHTKATQIDAVFASSVLHTGTLILPDTRLMTGTDHEIILSHMVDLSHTRQRKPRSQRGAREVVGQITVPSSIDQPTLEDMAAKVTRRRTTAKFSLSLEAKRLARAARGLRTAAAWKAYQHQVHREHVNWQQQRAARACRDWTQFRCHHRARKTQNHWAQGLTKSHDEDPFRSVISHFEGVFNAEGHAEDVSVIAALSESIEGVSARLTQEEVVAAVMRGKNNKSPGPDNVFCGVA